MDAEADGTVGWTQMTIEEGRALREAEKASKEVYFSTVLSCIHRHYGPYPLLADGPAGNVVCGIACDVEGVERNDRLATYETDKYLYTTLPIIIKFEDGTSCDGTAFLWNWGRDQNKLTEQLVI
jgi:hypothetical protein